MKGQITTTPHEMKFPVPTFPTTLFPFETESLFDTWNRFYNTLARRTFETPVYPERTGEVPIEISETEKELLVTAEVPGFAEKDLEIRVEPGRLFITAKAYETKEEKGKKRLYSERAYHQIFRYVDLPIQVNPDNATATVKDGILTVVMFKAKAPKLVPVSTIS